MSPTPYEPALKPFDEATEYNPNWRDAMVGALKKGVRNLTGGAIFPDQEKRLLDQNARSVIPEVSDPAKSQQIANLMMGFGTGDVGPALAGTIRAGGARNLHALHSLERGPGALMEPGTSRVFNEISSPSFALVKEGGRVPFRTTQSPIILPKIGAVDPANHPMQIFGRDAWTMRGAEMADALRDPKARLEQRGWGGLNADDMRLTEGATPPNIPYELAVQSTPRFRSLKEYEMSPGGAPALTNRVTTIPWASTMEAALMDWADTQGPSVQNQLMRDMHLGTSAPWLEMLNESASKRNPFARDILESLRNAPSEYGEGKSLGPMALTPEKIAAVMLPKVPVNDTGYVRPEMRALADQMQKRNVPVVEFEPQGARPTKDFWELVRAAQDAAGPFGGSR